MGLEIFFKKIGGLPPVGEFVSFGAKIFGGFRTDADNKIGGFEG